MLHLYEIGSLDALFVFDVLLLPEGVAGEAARLGVPGEALRGLRLQRPEPNLNSPGVSQSTARYEGAQALQPTDRQVLALARDHNFLAPVLTDDLALRREVESSGGVVVGTFGILLRRFRHGGSSLDEVRQEVERLLTVSTLHLSPPFRAYVRQRMRDLGEC
ncbi:MAG TPA: hypothetical protein VF017_10845 [Thermoanaerobaculia bacterium]|nr:hypothetical protein [Thermoanaerobaculia bacterium]